MSVVAGLLPEGIIYVVALTPICTGTERQGVAETTSY